MTGVDRGLNTPERIVAAFLRALLLKEDYKLREAAQAFDDIAAHYGEAEVCGDALFEAGLLFEALEAGRARTCYGTLVTKYPHHPRAADAAVRLKRLGR